MKLVLTLVASAMSILAATTAHAQADTVPAKSIRIIVPLVAGSAPDTITRRVAAHMSQTLNRSVIVENKPGFSGFIGGQEVVRGPADGSTLYASVSSFVVITPQVYSKIPYDPMKELKPLAQIGITPLVLAVNANGRYGSLADFVKIAKAEDGKVAYGSFGTGTSAHLMGEAFGRAGGMKLIHIPYKTSASTDVIGGSLDATIVDLGSARPFLGEPAKLKALGVTGTERLRAFPNIPTFQEQGYPALAGMGGWLGVFGPAGLAPETARALTDALLKAAHDPQVRDTIQTAAYQPSGVGGSAFDAIVRSDYQRWSNVLQVMGGVKLD